MAVGDTRVLPGFLAPVITQLSFQSHQLLFSHASVEERGENTPDRKFSRGLNSQPPGHESDMLTTEPPWRGNNHERESSYKHGVEKEKKKLVTSIFSFSPQ